MSDHLSESNWIGRLLAAVAEVSAIAVAIHYAAPWRRAAMQDTARGQGGGACAA